MRADVVLLFLVVATASAFNDSSNSATTASSVDRSVMDALRSTLDEFLERVVPSSTCKPVVPCSKIDEGNSLTSCYDPPGTFEHLSPATWFGTVRLLVLCATIQIVLVFLAIAWDCATSIAAHCGKKTNDELQAPNGSLTLLIDGIEVVFSMASCITFVVRAYRDPTYSNETIVAVHVADWVIAGMTMIIYVFQWAEAKNKFLYVWSKRPLLNMLTITSSSLVQVVHGGWVPFTFVRSMTANSALRRIFKTLDLPDLYEQLVLAVADFLALVFSFASIIFMLENLGNPPGLSIEETSNLTFFKSLWFVTVTVSTVGYGDVYPVSFLGKCAGIVFIVVGVYFFSSNISGISGLLQSQAEGHGRYSIWPGKKHIVVTGEVDAVTLRDFAFEFFHREHNKHAKGGLDMCLINTAKVDIERYVASGDLPVSRLQTLVGSVPTDLDRVGMKQAQAVFFFGDTRNEEPHKHDSELLLRAFTARKSNPKIEMYMTLLEPESLDAASGAFILCSTTFKTGLLSRSTFCPGIIPLIGNLLVTVDPNSAALRGHGKRLTQEYIHGLQHELYKVTIPEELKGQRFGDVVLHLFAAYGILILAVGSDENIAVHPGFAHKIDDDFAFVMAQDHPQEYVNESRRIFFANWSEDNFDLSEIQEQSSSPKECEDPLVSCSNQSEHVSGGNLGHSGKSSRVHPSPPPRNENVKVDAADSTNKPLPDVSAARVEPSVDSAIVAHRSVEDKSMRPMALDGVSCMNRSFRVKKQYTSSSFFDTVATLRPRAMKREISSLLDLRPTFDHESGTNGVVHLRDHIIVCGMPQRLNEFLDPIKFSMLMKDKFPSPRSKSECMDQYGQVVPTLFLWDGPISPDQLKAFQDQPSAYLLRVPPLNPSSLVKANVGQAMRIVLLTDNRLASSAIEPELIDSGVILAQRFIRQRFPAVASKFVCELVENENIHHLVEDRHTGSCSSDESFLISTEPVFSQGMVFSSSMCTSTLAQSFYNRHVLPLVSALLSTKVTNFEGSCSVGEVQLLQAEIPKDLQNKPYQHLLETFLRPHEGSLDLLPLGLYRRHDGAGDGDCYYTFTNPAPNTVVHSEDRVFYLMRTKPWKKMAK